MIEAMPQDLWQRLQKERRPILLYGMGNGAEKIWDTLTQYGIAVADVFASDGFVRGHTFRGKTVLSLTQAEEKYQDFVVLLCFGTALPTVLTQLQQVAKRHPLYVPDVPVVGTQRFDCAFYTEHKAELEQARALLSDTHSKQLFDAMVQYKLTGESEFLFAHTTTQEQDMASLLHPTTYTAYADLGAYNGDTISELLAFAPQTERVFAMEPDAHNYRKLCERAQREGWQTKLTALCAAAWDKPDTVQFRYEGNRNAGIGGTISAAGGKLKEVVATALDSFLSGQRVDYIKYDVEGAEQQALLGSVNTIAAYRPELCVSIYHKSEDLYALPLLLSQLCKDYSFYLRRRRCVPAWDLNLYAVACEKE